MYIIACIFFGLDSLPFFEIINPIMTPKNTIKPHFTRFKLMIFFAFLKANMNFYK
jgi:hypothetical protein